MRLTIAETIPGSPALNMQFQPESTSLDRTATLAVIDVAGRADPIHQWTGGKTSLSFDVSFYASEAGRQDATRSANWLQSLTYPDERGEVPTVLLIFGDLFKDYVFLVESANVKSSIFDNNPQNLLPFRTDVSLKLVVDSRNKVFNKQEIRNRI